MDIALDCFCITLCNQIISLSFLSISLLRLYSLLFGTASHLPPSSPPSPSCLPFLSRWALPLISLTVITLWLPYTNIFPFASFQNGALWSAALMVFSLSLWIPLLSPHISLRLLVLPSGPFTMLVLPSYLFLFSGSLLPLPWCQTYLLTSQLAFLKTEKVLYNVSQLCHNLTEISQFRLSSGENS